MELEKLKEIIADVLNVEVNDITEDTTFVDDLGADSLDLFELVMALEEDFDTEIPDEEAEKHLTLRLIMMTLSRSLQLEMLLSRSRMQQIITRQI